MSDVLTPPAPPTVAEPAGRAAPRADRPSLPSRHTKSGGGLPSATVALALVAIAVVLWAVWLTKTVGDLRTERVPIASVRLQPLIEEYVQAQARSGAPEQQVMAQTQAFMGALDAELLRRGRAGTTVLVAEAVLSKNVPDITADVRRAVHARVPTLPANAAQPATPAMPAMPQQGAPTMAVPDQPFGGGNVHP
jgi:hypothetical protein